MLGVTFFGLFLTPVFYVLLRGVEKIVGARTATIDPSQLIQVRGHEPLTGLAVGSAEIERVQ
jgi:hypothetical protein